MKKIIFLILVTGVALTASAQDIDQKNVPAVVLNAFQLKFANADHLDWKLKDGKYHVEFELNHKDHDLWMDNRGEILKHKQELWASEIPGSVIETVRNKCKFFDLDDAERTEEGNNIYYFINFEVDDQDCDIWLDGKGKLLKLKQELRKRDVPVPILTSIKDQFASFDLDDAERTEEGREIIYHLDGEVNDKDHDFWYDEKAKLLKHHQDLRKSEIPAAVMTAVSSQYAGYEIRDADKIEEGGKIIFDLELKKSKNRVNVKFDPEGRVLEVS